MRGCATSLLLCGTEQNASQVASFVAQRFGVIDWVELEGPDVVQVPPQWRVKFLARFVTRAEAEQVQAFIEDAWSGGPQQNRILSGSKVIVHTCGHDQALGDCRGGDVFESVKP